jgi:hypothetical protein
MLQLIATRLGITLATLLIVSALVPWRGCARRCTWISRRGSVT